MKSLDVFSIKGYIDKFMNMFCVLLHMASTVIFAVVSYNHHTIDWVLITAHQMTNYPLDIKATS